MIGFCPLEFSSLWDCLKGTTSSRFPSFVFFFFLFVEESVGEVLEVCLSRSWYAVRTDPPRLHACSRSMRVRSRAKHFRWTFDLAGASRWRRGSDLESRKDGMGSFEVEESLSIGNGFVDHAKTIFQRSGVELSGRSQVLENVDSLESEISYLARTLCLLFFVFSFSPLPKRLTLKAAWPCWVNQASLPGSSLGRRRTSWSSWQEKSKTKKCIQDLCSIKKHRRFLKKKKKKLWWSVEHCLWFSGVSCHCWGLEKVELEVWKSLEKVWNFLFSCCCGPCLCYHGYLPLFFSSSLLTNTCWDRLLLDALSLTSSHKNLLITQEIEHSIKSRGLKMAAQCHPCWVNPTAFACQMFFFFFFFYIWNNLVTLAKSSSTFAVRVSDRFCGFCRLKILLISRPRIKAALE